ncbi:MAG: MFS transporter [Parvularculaceae bacterium]|nr:MFS transporter [Parvularculaceae bacterium]
MTLKSSTLVLALSVLFFLITATTFASLGVLLPAMIKEFEWSWTTAGLGFTVLALATGVFSPVAASALDQLGARRLYAVGGMIMALGFVLMAGANGVPLYLGAAALIGAGFALLANVAGTYLVGRAAPERRRSLLIGAYLAAGGAGGVLGPLMANAGAADWRGYWLLCAIAVAIAAGLVAALAGDAKGASAEAPQDAQAPRSWRPREAMKTPAFVIIALALTVAYFCGVTVSTWSVAHLQKMGLAPVFAVGMLSLYSLANALSRAAGGVAVKAVSAKFLLIAALFGNVAGMTALAFATTRETAIAFAIFDGFAFGMALFATTALVIDYFGLKNSPALLGAVNLAATAAMAGPTLAGWAADKSGSFTPIFLVYAGAALLAAIAVALMKRPAARQ